MPRKKNETLVHLDLDTLSKDLPTKHETAPNGSQMTLGEELKTAREKKKLSLEEVAQKLRIREIYLEALEKGHYYVFPGLAYGVGFLRTYAAFLGLDAKDLVNRFHEETSGIKVEPIEMPIPVQRNLIPSFRMILASLAALLIVYLVWYIITNLYVAQVETKDPLVTVVEQIEESDMISPLPEETQAPEETQVIEAPIIVDSLAQTQQEVQMKPNEAKPEETTKAKIYGKKIQSGMALLATEEVWIRILDNDNVLFERVLYPNDRYYLPQNTENLTIRTGNAGALTVLIGDKEVRPLGQRGAFLNGFSLNINNFK